MIQIWLVVVLLFHTHIYFLLWALRHVHLTEAYKAVESVSGHLESEEPLSRIQVVASENWPGAGAEPLLWDGTEAAAGR